MGLFPYADYLRVLFCITHSQAAAPAVRQAVRVALLALVAFAGAVMGFAPAADAATVNAASCSQADVQAAINRSSTGDQIVIPNGNCGWSSGVNLGGRGLHITGATKQGASITHNAGSTSLFPITENASFSSRISNLRFLQGSGGQEAWQGMFIAIYAGSNGKPVLIDNNYFNITSSGRRAIRYHVNRGVIWQNTFNGNRADGQAVAFTPSSGWESPSTLGTLDTNGNRNVYFEDNVLQWFKSQAMDVDNEARVVIRHSTFNNAGMGSHGADTGIKGARHWEFYNNNFQFTNNGDCNGTQTINLTWYFYIRGGTGIIADNSVQNISSCAWGSKTEFNMQLQAVRRNAGAYGCYKGSYPMPYQIGVGHNGSNFISDPIYVWGNTGTGANSSMIGTSDYSPNECGSAAKSTNDYVKLGRDYFYGTPKPGYAKYKYPHPLRSTPGASADTVVPTVALTAPAAAATVAGSVAVSADASDDSGLAGVQFMLDGANLGAEVTAAPYTVTWDTTSAANGTHQLSAVARDAAGNTASDARTVTVANAGASAPSITSQPQNATVSEGQSANFSVVAVGSEALSYQWQRNGTNIAGATGPSYTTPATVLSDSGSSYRVIVSNGAGTVTSASAVLTVSSRSGASGSYNFNEGSGTTAADSAGGNRPGTLVNGPAWVAGKNGGGLRFDGSNDYVTIGNRSLASTFTLSAWVNNPANNVYETIASFGTNRQFSLSYGSLAFWDGTGTEYRFGAVPTGSWQHVAFTYDGGALRAYLNGTLLGSPLVRSIPAMGGRTLFGAWPRDASTQEDLLSGSLDDIRIYDRVLSQAEIQSDRATPVLGAALAQRTMAPASLRLAAAAATGPSSTSEGEASTPTPAEPAATGAVYYVDQTAGNDSNPGTQAQPWKNVPGMNGATAHTGAGSLMPGDTVYLDRDDTWTTSGSPQGFYLVGGVRYVGDEWESDGGTTGRRAKIKAGNDFNENGVVRFRDHLTQPTVFKGFEVDANSMSANGIDVNHGFTTLMNRATKRIENVEVHHVFSEQSKGEYKYGIALSNWAGNNGILENVEIINCSVHDVSRDAIVLYPSDDPNSRIGKITVRGCEIYNTGQDPGYFEGHGIAIKGWVYDSTIENNYVHNVDSSAVFISGPENDGGQRSAQNVVIRNNILTTQDNNGIVRLYKKGAKDLKIHGNLLLDNDQTGGLSLQGNSGTLDLLVYNNTFYNTFVDLGGHNSSVNTFEFKNNIVQYASNQLRNAASIKSASNNLVVASNPGLKNPADKPTGFAGAFGVDSRPNTDGFAPVAGSSAIDQGTTLAAAFAGSINSVARPQAAAWDIGAYEYVAGTSTDTSKPSVPTNLTARAASTSRINLAWTASTDNVGVTGYRLERCIGRGCTNFAQIGAPSGTSYGDAGLSAGTRYRYRVRAADAAGTLSGYSTIARADTPRTGALALGNVPASETASGGAEGDAADGTEGTGEAAEKEHPGVAPGTDLRLPILLAASEAEAGSAWAYIDAASGFADAVVIAGTPSINEDQPGVVRLSQVSGAGFELRFQEWDYLQRLGASAHAAEKIPYAVLQPGRYSMGDGTVWEVGTFPLDGASWQQVAFSEPFASAPAVFLTVQTANDPRAVTPRVRGVTAEGFDAALLQEEAQREGHGGETVGYLAIRHEKVGGSIDAGGQSVPYILQSVTANDRWVPVLSQRLRLEEDRSKDTEVRHPDESVDVLAIGRHIFAQQVSDNSADPTALRRLPPVEGAAMEWGLVRGVNSGWTVLPLAKRYTNPVVVARSVSSHDPAPGVIRLRQVAADRLELRYQEWNGGGAGHAKEDTFYMVAEAGRYTLGDLQVEAGLTGGSSGDWQRVAFTGGFNDAPVVLSGVQTANGRKAVSARVANITAASFLTAADLRPDEGSVGTGERIGWIAVEQGRNASVEGRQVRAFFGDIDGTLAPVRFPTATEHRHPTVVSDLNGSLDPTPVFLRHANPTSTQIKLRIARQEVAGTAATWHQQEKAGLFVGE